MLEKLDEILAKFEQIEQLRMDPAIVVNPKKLEKLGRQYAELEPLVSVIRGYKKALQQLSDAEELLGDPEMGEYAQEERDSGKKHV